MKLAPVSEDGKLMKNFRLGLKRLRVLSTILLYGTFVIWVGHIYNLETLTLYNEDIQSGFVHSTVLWK